MTGQAQGRERLPNSWPITFARSIIVFERHIQFIYNMCASFFNPHSGYAKLIQSLFRGAIAALFDLLQSIDEQ